MRAARRAGIQHATIPITAIITATPIIVTGSCGAMPKSSPRMMPEATYAAATPIARPIALFRQHGRLVLEESGPFTELRRA